VQRHRPPALRPHRRQDTLHRLSEIHLKSMMIGLRAKGNCRSLPATRAGRKDVAQGHEIFGHLDDGEAVERITIAGGGLTARVLTWGAVIQDLRLDGHGAPLVLGFETLSAYLAHSPYFGATPGRCANRIDAGRFVLDGTEYQLECNERGVTHLHGGSDGIGRRNWRIADRGADFVTLTIVDPAGRAGYPGNCTITCTYRLSG